MALTSKKYGEMYSKDTSLANGLAQEEVTDLESSFNNNEHIIDKGMFSVLKPVLYQIKLLQEELDYLRTEISNNKDNRIVIGNNTVISFGDMVEVSAKGKTTYNIVMTVVYTNPRTSKVTTKTTTLTLT